MVVELSIRIVRLVIVLLHGLEINVRHVDFHRDIVDLVEQSMVNANANVMLVGEEINVRHVSELTPIVTLPREELTTPHVDVSAMLHGVVPPVTLVIVLLPIVKTEELSVPIVWHASVPEDSLVNTVSHVISIKTVEMDFWILRHVHVSALVGGQETDVNNALIIRHNVDLIPHGIQLNAHVIAIQTTTGQEHFVQIVPSIATLEFL